MANNTKDANNLKLAELLTPKSRKTFLDAKLQERMKEFARSNDTPEDELEVIHVSKPSTPLKRKRKTKEDRVQELREQLQIVEEASSDESFYSHDSPGDNRTRMPDGTLRRPSNVD